MLFHKFCRRSPKTCKGRLQISVLCKCFAPLFIDAFPQVLQAKPKNLQGAPTNFCFVQVFCAPFFPLYAKLRNKNNFNLLNYFFIFLKKHPFAAIHTGKQTGGRLLAARPCPTPGGKQACIFIDAKIPNVKQSR